VQLGHPLFWIMHVHVQFDSFPLFSLPGLNLHQ
jgi:hypothetical protein